MLLNTVEVYDPLRDMWEVLDDSMATPRCDAGVCVIRMPWQWHQRHDKSSVSCVAVTALRRWSLRHAHAVTVTPLTWRVGDMCNCNTAAMPESASYACRDSDTIDMTSRWHVLLWHQSAHMDDVSAMSVDVSAKQLPLIWKIIKSPYTWPGDNTSLHYSVIFLCLTW
jgi:hypothetical protein